MDTTSVLYEQEGALISKSDFLVAIPCDLLEDMARVRASTVVDDFCSTFGSFVPIFEVQNVVHFG